MSRKFVAKELIEVYIRVHFSMLIMHTQFQQEIDLKAGGGYTVTIGEMCRMFMTKLDWFGTLFPRMPVNVGRDLEQKIKEVKLAARY